MEQASCAYARTLEYLTFVAELDDVDRLARWLRAADASSVLEQVQHLTSPAVPPRYRHRYKVRWRTTQPHADASLRVAHPDLGECTEHVDAVGGYLGTLYQHHLEPHGMGWTVPYASIRPPYAPPPCGEACAQTDAARGACEAGVHAESASTCPERHAVSARATPPPPPPPPPSPPAGTLLTPLHRPCHHGPYDQATDAVGGLGAPKMPEPDAQACVVDDEARHGAVVDVGAGRRHGLDAHAEDAECDSTSGSPSSPSTCAVRTPQKSKHRRHKRPRASIKKPSCARRLLVDEASDSDWDPLDEEQDDVLRTVHDFNARFADAERDGVAFLQVLEYAYRDTGHHEYLVPITSISKTDWDRLHALQAQCGYVGERFGHTPTEQQRANWQWWKGWRTKMSRQHGSGDVYDIPCGRITSFRITHQVRISSYVY